MRDWKFVLCLSAGLFFGLAAPGYAHHGTSVNYEMDVVTTIKGTVTKFLWRNPHSSLILDVTTESGDVVSHAVELPSPAAMAQTHGWSRHTFKLGDIVEMKVHPSKTGAAVSKSASCELGGCDPLVNGEPVQKMQTVAE